MNEKAASADADEVADKKSKTQQSGRFAHYSCSIFVRRESFAFVCRCRRRRLLLSLLLLLQLRQSCRRRSLINDADHTSQSSGYCRRCCSTQHGEGRRRLLPAAVTNPPQPNLFRKAHTRENRSRSGVASRVSVRLSLILCFVGNGSLNREGLLSFLFRVT